MSQSDNLPLVINQIRKQFWSQISISRANSKNEQISITKLKPAEFKKLLLDKNVNSVQINLTFDDTLKSWLKENHKDLDVKVLNQAILNELNQDADSAIIRQFIQRLEFCLRYPDAKSNIVMGLEPNLKSGIKVVIINTKSEPIAHTIVFPFEPQNQRSQALSKLAKLCEMYRVNLISIGTGNSAQETEQLVQELIRDITESDSEFNLKYLRFYDNAAMLVNEESNLDHSHSIALSTARRLQNPQSELSKAKLKYLDFDFNQQEVDQLALTRAINESLEKIAEISDKDLLQDDAVYCETNIESFKDLKVGQNYKGIVSNIKPYGLFVNIGIKEHGLVHISEIQRGFISDLNDVAIVGEKKTVWVKSIDQTNHQFSLSCIKPKTKNHTINKHSSGNQSASSHSINKDTTSKKSRANKQSKHSKSAKNTAFADALTKAFENKS